LDTLKNNLQRVITVQEQEPEPLVQPLPVQLPVGTLLPVDKLRTLLLAYHSSKRQQPSLADHNKKPLLPMRGR
jgi:hypothetical protein